MENSPMILLQGVSLTLTSQAGPVNILSDVSIRVEAGERVALIGPSGSGKSTLMMIAAGLERPSAGRVVIGGIDFASLDEDALAEVRRDQIGIVFQSFHLVPTMTALENVALPLELAFRRDALDLARDGLAAVGLGHRLTHYPAQLSGGEQQRVAIARAFVASPRLVLADEPTGNLDGVTGRRVVELLMRLCRENGTTLLVITHDRDLAGLCGRSFRMMDGAIVP
ncbi:MAG TPA: ATP-binding cassette domain-containing protein [Stellaceae bacterium]|nr:ATP-binding cassette domain-containing protein [Stellaceae bacterium]